MIALPRLPDDCSRCHDKGCPNRNVCLRWLRRDDEGWQVVSAATFRKEDGSCDEIIRLDPGHETYVRRH